MLTLKKKKEIVIKNYFKSDCDINTTIKEAYAKGFERGLKRQTGKWIEWRPGDCVLIMTGEEMLWQCSECGSKHIDKSNFCPKCGADMRGSDG